MCTDFCWKFFNFEFFKGKLFYNKKQSIHLSVTVSSFINLELLESFYWFQSLYGVFCFPLFLFFLFFINSKPTVFNNRQENNIEKSFLCQSNSDSFRASWTYNSMLKPRNIFSHNHIIFPKNHIVIPMFFLFYMFLPGGICLGDVQSKPKNTTPLIKNQGRCSFKRVYYRQHRCQVGWIHTLVVHPSTESQKSIPE